MASKAMASEAPAPATSEVPAPAISLPEVTVPETADENKFDCPPPYWLALITMGMSVMTTMTVAGSLFFVLAAPEKVSPRCLEFNIKDSGLDTTQALCTFSVLCFWTYPVVCCIFVVLLYAKNLVDQRVYYECLLHKVLIGFDRADPFAYTTVIVLLIYALCAFSALIWLHLSNPSAVLNSVYSSLAYISPIISFLAVILTQWSIQGKLITLPNFLEDYAWGLEHLNASHSYHVENVHAGYGRAEEAFDKADVSNLTTPQMVAYVEHYTKEFMADLAKEVAKEAADVEIAEEESQHLLEASDKLTDSKAAGKLKELAGKIKLTESMQKLGKVAGNVGGELKHAEREYIYWQWRLLFNPRLQDERAQDFRNWALGYFIFVVLSVLFGVYVLMCLVVTCLEIEKLSVPGTETWEWTHPLSLRPDLNHGEAVVKSLKQVAAKAVVSVMNDGVGKAFKHGVPSQFQLGVAA